MSTKELEMRIIDLQRKVDQGESSINQIPACLHETFLRGLEDLKKELESCKLHLDDLKQQEKKERLSNAKEHLQKLIDEFLNLHQFSNDEEKRIFIQNIYCENNGQSIFVKIHCHAPNIHVDPHAGHNLSEKIPLDITTFVPPVNLNLDYKTFRESAILDVERSYTKALLESNHGDVRKAAEQAGLTREAFYRVMSRCNLSPSEFRKID